MKINRLLGETIYLLNHGRTSAQRLAQHFEVSGRTIMRDMDILCMAGIPIASNYGADGGYEVMDTFKMDRQAAGENDYSYIIRALEGLASAYSNKEIEATLEKIKSVTSNQPQPVIMDLGIAQEDTAVNKTLFILNQAIQSKSIIRFTYTNSQDECKEIEAEPVAAIYKWYNWYLIAYSLEHREYRMYKLIRMNKLKVSDKRNTQVHNLKEVEELLKNRTDDRKRIRIRLLCRRYLRSRCREYLHGEVCREYENGDFEYEVVVPENEKFWYGVILSFGKDAKILEPAELIEQLKESCREILKIY